MTSITAPCKRTYRAVHTSGKRTPGNVLWIVLHDEESDTALNAARWFANPDSSGSAHLCVDEAECYRTLDNDDIPWGAHGANEHGFHIEQAGYAAWSSVLWLRHMRTLKRAAYKTALHCKAFGIPTTFVTAAGLKRNVPGVTTHRECSKAFGGTHSDPGLFWPHRTFMRYVREYRAGLDL
jgi:hypothetical protein